MAPKNRLCLVLGVVTLAVVSAAVTYGAQPVTLIVREDAYLVNGKKIDSLNELRNMVRPYEQPTIIVSGHVCADTERVTKAVEMIKEIGYRKVVLEAFGLFQDAECELPPERRWWRRSQ